MPILNPFENDAFNTVALTDAVNLLPVTYGRINQQGTFVEGGSMSNTILVEELDGTLTILPTSPRGSRGPAIGTDKRKVRSFVLPHINHPGRISPSEIQGVRAFGQESMLKTATMVMDEKMQRMRRNYDITKEYHRIRSIAGEMLDADGSVLFNWFTEFGITQKVVDFVLGTATTNIRNKCLEVVRHIETQLRGDTMRGVWVECSQTFFEALTAHANVEKAWENWQGNSDRLGGDPRAGFPFGGCTFREYIGNAPDKDGNTRAFVTAGDGRAYPAGTQQTFLTRYGPGDFMDTVNQPGTEIFVRQKVEDFNKGIELWSESNPIHMCVRPAVCVRVHSSN